MSRIARLLIILLAHVGLLQVQTASRAAVPSFTRGHIYTPVSNLTGGGQIVEWDQQLHEVRRFAINAEGTSGVTFNDRDNLVVITRRDDRVRIVEYDASGVPLDEYNTGNGTLLLGSSIDFDPVRKIYAFADDDKVTLLDKDLNFLASTPAVLQRASGVAFAADGSLYVTDQANSKLFRYNNSLATTLQVSSGGSVPTGIDFEADGHLLLTYFTDGELKRMDVPSLTTQTVLSGLGYGGISDVLVLPGGQLLTTDDRNKMRISTPAGALLYQTNGTGKFGDGLAFFPVPEPTTMTLMLATLVAGILGRSRSGRAGRAPA